MKVTRLKYQIKRLFLLKAKALGLDLNMPCYSYNYKTKCMLVAY